MGWVVGKSEEFSGICFKTSVSALPPIKHNNKRKYMFVEMVVMTAIPREGRLLMQSHLCIDRSFDAMASITAILSNLNSLCRKE